MSSHAVSKRWPSRSWNAVRASGGLLTLALIAGCVMLSLIVGCEAPLSSVSELGSVGGAEGGVAGDSFAVDSAGNDEGVDLAIKPALCPDPNTVWPNVQSSANSDRWISQNRDSLCQMRPRVLALNFVNHTSDPGVTDTNQLMQDRVASIALGLDEGTRFHGYASPVRPPFPAGYESQGFIHYEIAKQVDLSDHGKPPAGWNHFNSSRYPLKCSASDPYQFDYRALFSQAYADLYGIADSKNPSHNLTLCELVQQGRVHEVWLGIDGDPDPYSCSNGVKLNDFQTLEVLEYKQKYDALEAPINGQFEPCAGNGCFAASDLPALKACGRSIRILYVNVTRGPGCAIHSLGHGIEWTATSKAIPPFTTSFLHFANFDLKRFGANYPTSLYDIGCPAANQNCITYPTSNSLTFTGMVGGNNESLTMNPLNQGCGNVHYPPNARGGYDDQNTQSVLAGCEHYGLRDAPNGADQLTPYSDVMAKIYDPIVSDCEGGWQVYWRQNFPGHGSVATGADGKPVGNWWPYLFY